MSEHDTWNMFFAAVVTGWSAHFGYLDGESIELCAKDADALLAESKKRVTPEPTPPQPDDGGWIKWEGGECAPVSDVDVFIRFRCGEEDGPIATDEVGWDHAWGDYDVTAYRIVSEAGVTK